MGGKNFIAFDCLVWLYSKVMMVMHTHLGGSCYPISVFYTTVVFKMGLLWCTERWTNINDIYIVLNQRMEWNVIDRLTTLPFQEDDRILLDLYWYDISNGSKNSSLFHFRLCNYFCHLLVTQRQYTMKNCFCIILLNLLISLTPLIQ